jgi:hypothetical protein
MKRSLLFSLFAAVVLSVSPGRAQAPDPMVDLGFLPQTIQGDGYGPVAVQKDGRVLLGVRENGGAIDEIRRLRSDGTVDGTFAPIKRAGYEGAVTVVPNGDVIFADPTRVLRVDAKGRLLWNTPQVFDSGYARKVAVLPDGRILIGGLFRKDFAVNNFIQRGILRFSGGGAPDAGYSPALPGGPSSARRLRQ